MSRAIFLAVMVLAAPAWAAAPAAPAPKGAGDASAAVPDIFEARVYRDASGGELAYRLLKPENYDAAKKYPLVVFLHGSGERGSDNAAQLKNGVRELLGSPDARVKYPCFFMVPQSPMNDSWGRAAYPESGVSDASRRVLEVIQAIEKEFSIDPARLYIGGLSMGGFGTWDLITLYPDLFAAAFPVCGGGAPARAPLVKGLPLFVADE